MSATATSDFAPWEIGAAIVISVAVQFAGAVGLYLSRSATIDLPEVDKGAEVPVKVMPVLDEDAFKAAKLGGKKAVLPDMWQRAPTAVKKAIQDKPAPPPDVAGVSTNASERPEDAPKPDKKVQTVEDAGTEERDAAPEDGSDAGSADSDAADGSTTSTETDGSASGPGGEGCVGEGCTKDGTNPDFVAAQYQGKLIAFFKRGFVVSGLGLPPEDIAKLSVAVTVQLSGGVMTGFSMSSSGNATFDAAARASLEAKKGSPIPNPPEDRPDLDRSSLSFTMVCGKSCN
jgi:outer membrane biosynthesis protein TonB